jgi:hypothetical protein
VGIAVSQPADCERVLKEVGLPNEQLKDDFRVLYFRAKQTIKVANRTIREGRACITNQRILYSNAGKGK